LKAIELNVPVNIPEENLTHAIDLGLALLKEKIENEE